MIDFVLGLSFASLALRGWVRGFARELMDLVGLILGLALAFRLSEPAGAVVESWTNASPEMSRFIGGFAIFLVVGVLASLGARLLHRFLSIPGLALSNRLLGAALALAWGVFLGVLVLSLAKVLPLPAQLAEPLSESKVAAFLIDPDGVPERVFQTVAGDRVLTSLLNLEDLVGGKQVILEEGETLEIPAADPADLSPDPASAKEIFELVNRSRVEADLDPLSWSDALAEVAQSYARQMYLGGFFSHTSPDGEQVQDRVQSAGITYRVVGENLALAATPRTVHEGLMSSPGHRANILRPGFTRVGIGVIEGPLGLMVVEVFTG